MTGYPDRHDGLEYDGTAANHTIDHWPGREAGFGLLQLNTLFDSSTYRWWLDQTTLLTSTEPSWSRTFVIENGNKDTRLSLAWTDVPAAGGAVVPIINKLEFSASFPDCSQHYRGNVTDNQNNSTILGCRQRPVSRDSGPSDTVTVINIPAGRYPTGTTFTLTVTATLTGTAIDEQPGPNQDFALFTMNARPQ